MRVAVDVMGTDYGPGEIVRGAIQAVHTYGCEVALVGDKNEIEKVLKEEKSFKNDKISVCHASEVIEMCEQPSVAVRKKKDSSIVIATKLLKTGDCQAVISAGSTGAAVAAALFGLGRIRGIERPAIATHIPNKSGVTVLLDSGANVDSKPQHMVQAAIMGSLYAQHILEIHKPRVGLLNIGEEESKGNEQVLATYPLLQDEKSLNFTGNAEGRDITNGKVDVIVCDGFVGNVVLKSAEGLAMVILEMLKDAIKQGGFFSKAAAMVLMPALRGMKKKMESSEYGGAPLLGVNGTFIICHGSSKAKAIKNAIGVAVTFDKNNLLEHIEATINNEGEAER